MTGEGILTRLLDWFLKALGFWNLFLAAALLCAFLRFAPDDWATGIGFERTRTDYREQIVIAMLFSILVFVIVAISRISPLVVNRIARDRARRQRKITLNQKLDGLDQQERTLLLWCMREKKTTFRGGDTKIIRNLSLQGIKRTAAFSMTGGPSLFEVDKEFWDLMVSEREAKWLEEAQAHGRQWVANIGRMADSHRGTKD